MSKEAIKTFNGKIIGCIETKPSGDKVVTNFTGRILGYYKKGPNITTDALGRTIARGDACAMLLR